MVKKKPASAAPAKSKAATTKRPPRPSLPALSGKPDFKAAAAHDTEVQEAKAGKSADAPEKLGKKLRTKGDILAALRHGAHVLHTETGLYRVVAQNGALNPASKRRVLSLMNQGILKAGADARTYVFDREAEKKSQEKKTDAQVTNKTGEAQ